MALSLSKLAAEQVQHYLEGRGHGLGIRLIAQASECSGMAYRIEFVDEEGSQDQFFECHGAKIYVDAPSLVFVDGTTIDFAREGDEEGFLINNPNLESQCGCGGGSCV